MKFEKGSLYVSTSNRLYLWTLYAISIVCGASFMALEIAGGRLLTPFFGGSVYVWGSIIGVFLIALSLGYYLGGIAADRKPNLAALAWYIALSGMIILIIPPLAPRLAPFFFATSLSNYGALIVALLLFFLPSLGLGMVSPYVVKLGVKETDRLGNLVGKFYAISTFGSIGGTFSTTFFLVPLFGVREVILAIGIILAALATIILLGKRLLLDALGVISCMILILIGTQFLVAPVPEALRSFTLTYEKQSLYNDILVRDDGDKRFLMFNDDSFQSGMSKSNPTEHVFEYTRLMDDALAHFRPASQQILLIGLGGGSIPRALLAKHDDIHIDAVEIDPDIVEVAHNYFALPNDPRLRTFAMDGRLYLQSADRKYDVVMIDAYNRFFIPYHLTTEEFFRDVAGALQDDGVVIINTISSVSGEHSRFLKSLLRTSDRVFPERRIYFAQNRDENAKNNLVLVVSKRKLTQPGVLAGFPEHKKRIDTRDSIVLSDNYAPVEALAASLMKP